MPQLPGCHVGGEPPTDEAGGGQGGEGKLRSAAPSFLLCWLQSMGHQPWAARGACTGGMEGTVDCPTATQSPPVHHPQVGAGGQHRLPAHRGGLQGVAAAAAPPPNPTIDQISWTCDDQRLVVSVTDHSVRVFDMPSGHLLHRLCAHTEPVSGGGAWA